MKLGPGGRLAATGQVTTNPEAWSAAVSSCIPFPYAATHFVDRTIKAPLSPHVFHSYIQQYILLIKQTPPVTFSLMHLLQTKNLCRKQTENWSSTKFVTYDTFKKIIGNSSSNIQSWGNLTCKKQQQILTPCSK